MNKLNKDETILGAIAIYLIGIALIGLNANASEKLARLNFEQGMTIVIETNRYDAETNHTWTCMTDSECEAEMNSLNEKKGE